MKPKCLLLEKLCAMFYVLPVPTGSKATSGGFVTVVPLLAPVQDHFKCDWISNVWEFYLFHLLLPCLIFLHGRGYL